MPAEKRRAAICDANVLIDYVRADEGVLPCLAAYWDKVFVPDLVLAEVRQLDEKRARRLGLTVIESPLTLPQAGGLSLADRACLHFALEKGWTCIANDRRLRNECIQRGGTVIWGLQMLLELVSDGQLPSSRARHIGVRIKAENPQITESILNDFLGSL